MVLGFNRLSIIDVEHSHQPLHWDPDPDRGSEDRYTIVFNGEIYNYLELRAELAQRHGTTFATEGTPRRSWRPTTTGARPWCGRLRGMFAFLIWDAQERVLFGARDPFGIKPLFVAAGPGGVAFGSEKKSLLEIAPTLGLAGPAADLDAAALQHYLLLQYVPEPATMHRGSGGSSPGTHVTVRPGGEVDHERYFTPVLHGARRARPRRCTRGSPTCCATRWPSTCAPT